MARDLVLDALPMLLRAGIAEYVRGLARGLAAARAGRWNLEFFFRLAFSSERGRAYRACRAESWPGCVRFRTSRLPDRWIARLWEAGLSVPGRRADRAPAVFLATTDLVPRGPRVGWVVYDLTPLMVPRFFNGSPERFLEACRRRAARADFIVAISEATRRDVIERLGYPESRITVVYPGAAAASTPERLAGDAAVPTPARPYVCYVGGLALNKNVDGLLRVFARVVREHGLDLDLVLIGKDFQPPGYWASLVRSLGVADRVRFTGWVSDAERLAMMRRTVMLWQFSWYEGFGLPVLEAAAQGVPVLVSNRGALPEILRASEQEMDPDDEPAAAARAAAALSNPAALEAWSRRGRERAAAFSWKRSAASFLDWLETLQP